MLIEVFLIPKNTTLNSDNRMDYIAGSTVWHGINRHKKCCKRCNKSRTNLKIDIEDYILENNIKLDDLKDYEWFIEGQGRLHQPNNDNKFIIYSQDEIVQDGSISLIMVLNN